MPNYNTDTGIRYGVIALNSINPDVANDLMFGSGAVDVDYAEAVRDNEAHSRAVWDQALEEAEIAASEADHNMSDSEREAFIESHMEKTLGHADEESYVDDRNEQFAQDYQNDEALIQGETGGVQYQISYLGGAPLLWVFSGPVGSANSLCSPCVPGAADLDSGFTYDNNLAHECYVVPANWMENK